MTALSTPVPPAVRLDEGPPARVVLVDQRALPGSLEDLVLSDVAGLVAAIRSLAVRGAPAIGIAGAYGLLLEPFEAAEDRLDALGRLRETAATLLKARPTAVNLRHGLQRMVARADQLARDELDVSEWRAHLTREAHQFAAEDAAACQRMGELAAELIAPGARILTHCHAGALATGGIGTALAGIHVAAQRGLGPRVYACETRPLLQGARLTAWELMRAGIEVTLLTDGAAAGLIARGTIDLVIVGSDRIARNGDVANKVGTLNHAHAAARYGVPFMVVAPTTTIDLESATGADIPIEERAADEVRAFAGRPVAPPGVAVWNPAFDVTPAELVTHLVTERGRLDAPDEASIVRLLAEH